MALIIFPKVLGLLCREKEVIQALWTNSGYSRMTHPFITPRAIFFMLVEIIRLH